MVDKIKRKGKKGKKLKSEDQSRLTSNKRERYARVLDYLPYGHPDDPRPVYQKKPLVHAVGTDAFVLMELSPKRDKIPEVHDQVYIGEGEREVIDHVIKRLRYTELTPTAKIALPHILEEIVKADEKKFIQVFNNPKGILEKTEIGIRGEKLRAVLNERGKGEFSGFDDLMQRVKGLRHPEKIIAKMIEYKIKLEKGGENDKKSEKREKKATRKRRVGPQW